MSWSKRLEAKECFLVIIKEPSQRVYQQDRRSYNKSSMVMPNECKLI